MLRRRPAWLLLVLPVLLPVLLYGCGFHLRGQYQLNPALEKTWVQTAAENSELVRQLRRQLRASGVALVKSADQASAVLRLSDEKQTRRVVSVDARGRAREYQISYSISFEVEGRGNDFALPQDSVSLTRDYLFDTEDVLGKGREEASLVKDMQQDIVRLIMLKLEYGGSHENPTGSD